MSSIKQQTKQLLTASTQVFQSAVKPNGAIVIAPERPHVIPHHAAFAVVAAPIVGLDLASGFFTWLEKTFTAQDTKGALASVYTWEGAPVSTPTRFSPEQNGAMLWSIEHYLAQRPEKTSDLRALVELLAQGIVQHWKKNGFSRTTTDMWGDEHAPEIKLSFTYALAACAHGLEVSAARYKQRRWKNIAAQMRERIGAAWDEEKQAFYRASGHYFDTSTDALMLGLAWPYHIYPANEKRIQRTVHKIEEVLVESGGVHRYQYDYHDSEGKGTEGGGVWPALNFWMSIYFAEQGDETKARSYFQWVLERVHDELPEQLFKDFRRGLSPFVWSHAMFLLAAKKLKLLPNEA